MVIKLSSIIISLMPSDGNNNPSLLVNYFTFRVIIYVKYLEKDSGGGRQCVIEKRPQ